VVLGLAQPAGPDLDRLADTIIVGRVVVEAGEFVGDLDLPVGGGESTKTMSTSRFNAHYL
jgi:hypothetical protein